MVMPHQSHIDIKFIEDRYQSVPESQHILIARMIGTAVDGFMHQHNSMRSLRIFRYSQFHCFPMLFDIVSLGVQGDKQRVPIGKIKVTAGIIRAQPRLVGRIEIIGKRRVIMVAD